MTSREENLPEDRQRRPALATGLQTHRPPARQASPRRRHALGSPRVQLSALALAAIVVAVLLHVSGASDGDVGQPVATAEPVVAEATPDTETSASALGEPAVVAPDVVPEAIDTATPVAAVPPAPVATAAQPTAPVATAAQPTAAVGTAAQPTALAPTAPPTPLPAPSTPVPQAASTPSSANSEVWVGNTGGSGVYVRRTPTVADRLRAYEDGTLLTVIGEDVTGDGQHWKHVRAPDGLEGYVPAAYVLDTAP